MTPIEYREYGPQDADSLWRLHNAVFPPVSAAYWSEWWREPVTAAVAVLEGEVVGAVPFHLRQFCPQPGVSVPVAVEWSVGVREDLRGKGLGSALMAAAKQFLRGRCLAMLVYRNSERSNGYRYYARNGHHDMIYLRPWVRHGETTDSIQVVGPVGIPEFLAHEQEVLAIYASAYDTYGGSPQRQTGYYAAALKTIQYAEVPLELGVLWRWTRTGALCGYAVIGEERVSHTLHLLELATLYNDPAEALALLADFAGLADRNRLPAQVYASTAWPYLNLLPALGFEQPTREGATMLMAHVLDPEGLAQVAWREHPGTANLEVWAWTPDRQVRLHRTQGAAGRRIVLEMKEEALTRLLLARLDLPAAVAQESVTAVGAGPAEVEAIAQALPRVAWSCQYLDFI